MELLIPDRNPAVILVAGIDDEHPEHVGNALRELGHKVIGPFPTAELALEAAREVSLDGAVVFRRLAGRRDGEELAAELERTCGVGALIIGGAPDGP